MITTVTATRSPHDETGNPPDSAAANTADHTIDKARSIPSLLFHILPFGVFFTGIKNTDLAIFAILYLSRIFFITGFYHRYFSHRSYKMNRIATFAAGFLGTTCVQKGPLWWAAHHRDHHRCSDTENDVHSPIQGFWWSHMGWILAKNTKKTDYDKVKDWARYPELVWLNKYFIVAPILLGIAVFFIGGPSALLFGFFGSTVAVWHATFFINSLAHILGTRRFATDDTSRNFFPLALLTLGEGWHNNHHHLPYSMKSGLYWWEIDITYRVLQVLSWVRIVKHPHMPRPALIASQRIDQGAFDAGTCRVDCTKARLLLSAAVEQNLNESQRITERAFRTIDKDLLALRENLDKLSLQKTDVSSPEPPHETQPQEPGQGNPVQESFSELRPLGVPLHTTPSTTRSRYGEAVDTHDRFDSTTDL